MKKRAVVFLLIFALVFVSSCQTIPEEHKGAATGAGVGAAAGAVLGQVFGKNTKSTIIGGLIGALVGGAIGHYFYDRKRTGAETADKYNYDSSEGLVLKIEDASIVPQFIGPGGKVDILMTYAVLMPSADGSIEITEKREIRYNGELVGNPEVRVTRSAGTYTASVSMTLPADAKKGLYIVTYTVKSGDETADALQSSFTVK